ncbi:hypothetical protein ACFLSX_01355 [Calditrichota bacterium]
MNRLIKFIIIFTIFGNLLFAQTNQWKLIWDQNPENDISHYLVFKDISPSSSTQIGSISYPDTIYTDSNIQRGIQYYYRVKAVNDSALQSQFSQEVSAAIPIINLSNLSLPADSTIFLDLDDAQFVNDPDNSFSELSWSVSGGNSISISINQTTHVATITTPADTNIQESFSFSVADPDSFYDTKSILISLWAPLFATPIVHDIPDQTIFEDESFEQFDLDTLVEDTDNSSSELTWSSTGGNVLSCNIDNNTHIVTISNSNPDWIGSETITFRATDPDGLFDEDAATFTIIAVDKPPVVYNIPDQMIFEDESFKIFDLDTLVEDADNTPSELSWTFNGQNKLFVNFDSIMHIVTVIKTNPNWIGSETIVFRATDPTGLFDEDAATFSSTTSQNHSPKITSVPDTNAFKDELYRYKIIANDEDKDSLSFKLINNQPDFLHIETINNSSALILGIPTTTDIGEHEVEVFVSDGNGGTDHQFYILNVISSSIEKTDEVNVFPIPFIVSESRFNHITFNKILPGSRLLIYNILGEPVFNKTIDTSPFYWDIRNNSGLEVQSGLYIYYIKSNTGQVLSSNKLVIIR